MNHSEKIALLQLCAPLADAPSETLEMLATALEPHVCLAHDVIIRQGESSQTLYIIDEGRYSVTIAMKDAPAETISILERGSIFGEIGVVSGIPATATIRSISEGRLLRMSAPDFHRIMNGSPKLAEAMLRSLAEYLSPK